MSEPFGTYVSAVSEDAVLTYRQVIVSERLSPDRARQLAKTLNSMDTAAHATLTADLERARARVTALEELAAWIQDRARCAIGTYALVGRPECDCWACQAFRVSDRLLAPSETTE